MCNLISDLDPDEVPGVSIDEMRESYLEGLVICHALTDIQVDYSTRLFEFLWQRLLERKAICEMNESGYFCPTANLSKQNKLLGLD